MKNIIFGILVALSSTSAFSGIIAEASKNIASFDRQACNEKPGLYWVEANKECVPRNVCDILWNGRYETYCIRDFASTQVKFVGRAEHLSKSYLENVLQRTAGIDCGINMPEAGDKKSFSGDNYIPCLTTDGRFFVFQFDDTTEKFAGTPYPAFLALCRSLGGNGSWEVCAGLTKEQCKKIDDQLDNAFVGDDDTKYDEATGDCRYDG